MTASRLPVALTANLVSYVTTGLVALLLTPYLINELGKATYSFYPLANSFILYISVIGTALNSMASRFVTIAFIRQGADEASRYAAAILRANIILAFSLIPILGVLVYKIDAVLNVAPKDVQSIQWLFALIFAAALLRVISSVYGVAVFVADRLDIRAYIELASSAARVASYVLLYTYFTPSIVFVGLAILLTELLAISLNAVAARRVMPDLRWWGVPFSTSALRKVLASGVWNSVNQLGAILISSVSLVLANLYLGPTRAGTFAIAVTVPAFVAGLVSMIGSIFTPRATHHFAANDRRQMIAAVTHAQGVSAALTSCIVGLYSALAFDFFRVWVPREDASLLTVLSLLSVAHLLFTGATWPVSNLNIAMNRVRVPAVAMVGAGVISLITSVVLLQVFELGLLGLAVAALAPNLFLVLVFVPLYPCRELRVSAKTFYPPVIKVVFGCVAIFLMTSFFTNLVGVASWLDLCFAGCLSAPFAILAALSSQFGFRATRLAIQGFVDRLRGHSRTISVDDTDAELLHEDV